MRKFMRRLFGQADGDGAAACGCGCDKSGGGAKDVSGLLVVAVDADVAASEVEALQRLTDRHEVWRAIVLVAGRLQADLTKRAIVDKDNSRDWLMRSDGVAILLAELMDKRRGVREESK